MLDPDTLIQQYLEGTLTTAGARDLQSLLEARPELGEQLLQHLEMDAMLRATNPQVPEMIIPPALPPKRLFTLASVSSMAALAACITLLATWALRTEPKPDREAITTSVAVLRNGEDLEWESATITTGTQLSPGRFKLKSGIALIEFYQGARVAIAGPAEFQLISSSEATCTRGKLSASVPPQAIGFRINTPKGSIVDLGTEFGLDVNDSKSEVHVFKGKVELHQNGEPIKPVEEGQALSFAADLQLLVANPAEFASLKGIKARSSSSERALFERWLEDRKNIKSDPTLKVYFNFQDNQGTASLRNHAPLGKDGSIVGTSWTKGRWPGKRALDFGNISDRVRLNVPGETRALTMAVSVRVDGLYHPRTALFMSDGWMPRNIHWQIIDDGKIRFGAAVVSRKSNGDHYDTPVYFTPERFGSWVNLAVVFDPAAKELRHYANGTLLASHPLMDGSPLFIGLAELGNWNRTNDQSEAFNIRYLSGAMDEFALWDRALSDAEIAAFAR